MYEPSKVMWAISLFYLVQNYPATTKIYDQLCKHSHSYIDVRWLIETIPGLGGGN